MSNRLTEMTVNKLPTLTWNFLKINDIKVKEDIELNGRGQITIRNIPDGVIIGNAGCEDCGGCAVSKIMETTNSITNGMGPEAKEFFDSVCDKSLVIRAKKNAKIDEPLCISYNMANGDANAVKQVIIAEEGSNITVVMDYNSKSSDSGFFGVQTILHACRGATINLVKIELLGKGYVHFDDIGGSCDNEGIINTVQMILGGKKSYVGLNVDLAGYKSRYSGNTGYLCINDQFLDMNYYIGHRGKKSEGELTVKGALRDEAVKTFRGTIDLKHGAKGAKGDELEETLLLSEKVKNNTLPVILCDEDDVEGAHGATIGRLSKDMLFYMESRGFSEHEAEVLMTKGKLNSIRNLITDQSSIGKIQHYMEEAFRDE
ncbi:MAG: SufD family Fe-S cluster assembly protein [Lachnospiraceae bacterium]|nr:SufD family Fe-S cluster assembly protein [Lachnospiraceae bacterium]